VRLRNKLGSATLLVAFLFIFLVVLPLAALFGLLLARLALVMLAGLTTLLTLSGLSAPLLTLLFDIVIVAHELLLLTKRELRAVREFVSTSICN
jgi:hypothetical protein